MAPQTDKRTSLISQKPIPPRERLIVALDVPGRGEALELVEVLGESVAFYKVGLELFMAGGYYELIADLTERGKKVFVDLKFFDVPETVARAVAQVRDRGVEFVTVHGQDEALRKAVQESNGVKILAVTALTSLTPQDMDDLGFKTSIEEVVLSRAKRALEIGCHGVISSGMEAARLRSDLGDRFLIVAPGIRPGHNVEDPSAWDGAGDDQKRTVTVQEAFLNGADYIVVGRPIRDAADPSAEAERMQETIRAVFS